jgi:cobalt-zinc-cadmium efflux system membrane fusion protein
VKRFALCILCLVLGCSRQKDEAKTAPTKPAMTHGTAKRLELPAELVEQAKIKTEPVRRESLTDTLDLPGEIASDPDKTAHVAAPVAGRITRVSFKEGLAVKKGQAIASIRVPELGKIRSALVSTLAQAKAAHSNAERLKALRAQGFAGEQEALNAEAEAESLEAEARALEEQLGAMGIKGRSSGAELSIRAPVDGVVLERHAVIGQPVTPEETIATIADLRELWFTARLFEQAISRVAAGARADVRFDALPNERFEGLVAFIGNQIDPATRAVGVRIPLTNRNGLLKIGLFGTAHVALPGSKSTEQLVVSREAIYEIDGKSAVFVRQSANVFELRPVITGDSTATRVAVRAGIRENDEVVVEGGFTLKSLALKSSFAEGE